MTIRENKSISDSAKNKCPDVSIAEIMSKDVITVAEDETLENIIKIFEEHHFHTYPVLSADGELVGVINQNIVLEVLLFERISQTKHTHLAAVRSLGEDAKGIMIPHPITISYDTGLCDAAEMMLKHNIDRACVTDDGKLIGIVSKRDVINEVYRSRSPD
ncbi:MAG: CBS domain-containing protein [Methanosarcinaceae archaeon]